MFDLGRLLDRGEGVAAADHPAAAGWYRRAADAGHGQGLSLVHLSAQPELFPTQNTP